MKNEIMNTVSKKAQSFGLFLNKHGGKIAVCMMVVMLMSTTAFATAADQLWNTVAGQIEKWVGRMGGVVMLVGFIMFGLGWQQDDASRKSQGISTIIAGAIVLVAAGLTAQFFA